MTSASFAALCVVVIGLVILWSNPWRQLNRFFFSLSLHIALWLWCIHEALTHGENPISIRVASAIGAFVPVHMWLIKEACVGRTWRNILRRSLGWAGAAITLTIVSCTDWYVSGAALAGNPRFGLGYFAFVVLFVGMYGMLCRSTITDIRDQVGIVRIELQLLLLAGSAMCFAIIALMVLRGVVHEVWPVHLQPLCVLIFYAGTVYATTTHRIFDARQIVLILARHLLTVLGSVVLGFTCERALRILISPLPIRLFIAASITILAATILGNWLAQRLELFPAGIKTREAAFAVATQARPEELERSFLNILEGWGQSERALLFVGTKDQLRGADTVITSEVIAALRDIRWITPERLERARPTVPTEALRELLTKNRLSILAFGEGNAVSVAVGIGANVRHFPFTYPQAQQLVEFTSIVVSGFERLHFAAKAQHAEQLATAGLLGASVAHEIQNPLIAIRTFVQMLPAQHDNPEFRKKFFELIGDEVHRIDQLTKQLLDLTSPRMYSATPTSLHPVIGSTIQLLEPKAAAKCIKVHTDLSASSDRVLTDSAAVKQVLLNLGINAIQAFDDECAGTRKINIATRHTTAHVEVVVSDTGPGIRPELIHRLFQPFQTTKSTGFGLGLAICRDILENLGASIALDDPVPGEGATFRLRFPAAE